MEIFALILTVFIGLLCFVIYFGLSNFVLDYLLIYKNHSFVYENSIRVLIFIAPAFIVLFVFILYPVFETVRLSFYDKFGREFVGLHNYLWAINDPNFRRSILNNLGWLLIVPTLSTFFGLVIANLTDRIWWGTIAKSIIFMPMAISFVGAGVIWKFIYDYRGTGDQQIGLLNAIVVSFGFEPQAWLTIAIWNNLFLMAIMIWIQTGLALVIFSAALRGIPKETLEAARMDGASELRIFWSIIIPFLERTILVIWTMITILVLRVFDVIYAMTNGEWQTEVLANLMYDWMFRGGGDSGRGSVLAFCIMIGVIPILVWNLYRHRQEQQYEN
jgi:alpha-glucoside transport system permease protein|tara:strand:+ start:3047 stop:4036 length:990 start_codon:yes stop_codon:yes gene_type:complete